MFLWIVCVCVRVRACLWESETHKIKRNNERGPWQNHTNMCDKLNIIFEKKIFACAKGFVCLKMDRKIQRATISVEDSCGETFAASQANEWRSVLKEISGPLIKMTAPLRESAPSERSAGFVPSHKRGQTLLWRTFDLRGGTVVLRISLRPPLTNSALLSQHYITAGFCCVQGYQPASRQRVYELSVSPLGKATAKSHSCEHRMTFIYFFNLFWFTILLFWKAFRLWPRLFRLKMKKKMKKT